VRTGAFASWRIGERQGYRAGATCTAVP
jgi:hypothetical protein